MKSLAELEKIRDRMKHIVDAAEAGDDTIRVVVGMATCGIAAGARPVLNELNSEIVNRGLSGIVVSQTGCIGICQYEPVVEVFVPGKDKITYVHMNADKVSRIIDEHIIAGEPITEYTFSHNVVK